MNCSKTGNCAILVDMENVRPKSVSQRDIAKEAGLCIATVSRVLTGKADATGCVSPGTCRKVREAAARLGYRLNIAGRMLRLGRSDAVGLLFSAASNLYMELVPRLQRQVFMRGRVALCGFWNQDCDAASTIAAVAAREVDGIITCHWPEAMRELAPGVPTVHFLGEDPAAACVNIGSMLEMQVRHLAELGHRRIVLFGPWGAHEPHVANLASSFGLHTVFVRQDFDADNGPSRGGLTQALDLLGRPGSENRPTALVCHTDVGAALSIAALVQRGFRVPEDISVGSAEGLSFGQRFFPPITAVGPDLDVLAKTLVETLFRRLENPALPPQRIQVPLSLFRGESTGKAPAK